MKSSNSLETDCNLDEEKLLDLLLAEEGIEASSAEIIPLRVQDINNKEKAPFLSFGQQRLWFLHQLEPNNPFYNNSVVIELKGLLDVEILEKSLNEIVQRHEALRTNFSVINNQPVHVIASTQIISMPVVNLQELTLEMQPIEAKRLIKQEAQQPFNLNTDPLLRVTLLKLGSQAHILVLTIHHIISDGWSIGIFIQELGSLYKTFLTNAAYPLTHLPVQYADFAEWQRQWLQGDRLEQQLSYWRQQLAGVPPVLHLPTDRPRPSIQSFRGDIEKFYLDRKLTEQLRQISHTSGGTLYMVLLTAFSILLYRYSDIADIVIGSPIANRNRVEIEGLIGFFANTLALRIQISDSCTYLDLLKQVQETTLAAYSHQDLPFETLVDELKIERHLSHNALFQVVFALQNAPMPSVQIPDLEMTADINFDNGTVRFDLEVHLWESSEGLKGDLVYNTDLFDSTTIKRLIGNFQTLLEGIVSNPHQQIIKLPILTKSERHQLLVDWTQTETKYPRDRTIQELFEEQVEINADAIAVVFGGQQLTYQQLNQRANQLARYLQKFAIRPDVLVGIYIERSIEMVVGLLGILKAGGAYVPLDPSYPQERLDYMIEDAQLQVLLTVEKFLPNIKPNIKQGKQIVCLDSNWQDVSQEVETNPISSCMSEHLAYVEYTSGSTGRPKGVCITHRGVVRLVKNTNYLNFGADEVFLQLAPVCFDASTFEIWGSLLNGAKLAIMPAHTPSLEEIGKAIRDYQVTTMWLTTGLFKLMVDERLTDLHPLRYLITGGDALSVPHVQRFVQEIKNCQLVNGYGPTENTTFTTCCHIKKRATQLGISVPIGQPIANTQVYILDRNLQPVAIGVYGEIYIGGDGLARGYLNNPILTAEKFIPNPFNSQINDQINSQNSAYLYKTGDLAKYLPDGNIDFLGRIDSQVKIRGFRIELNEIESILIQHPDIREVVVIAREDRPGNKQLVAYVVSEYPLADNHLLTMIALRAFLKEKVPEYMIPASVVIVDAIPLNSNGKLDRRNLPAPTGYLLRGEEIFVAPSNPVETQIANVWSQVLGLDQVGINDNFFDSGGNSLLFIQVHSKLQELLGQAISIVDLFRYPTISLLTQFLSQEQDVEQITVEKSRDRIEKQKQIVVPIAIVGMSGRFPGAKNIDQFWHNLRDGVESISTFSDEELLATGVDPEIFANPNYIRAFGVLPEVEWFDANFFGFNAREAEVMDPQHRIFLESAWEAIESAGYNPKTYEGQIGVFCGTSLNSYWLKNLALSQDLHQSVSDFQILLGNDKDFVPTRVSYKLNLRGPSVSVNTACSTSLVAVQMACQSLLNSQCDIALAGGVAIRTPQKIGYLYQEGMILSPDGHCRTFDAQSKGTVGGSGVGIVVLKRLSDAIADGDFVYAVIRGAAINNDGAMKVGYTAPSIEGQTAVITEAQALGEIDPATISYIEAHGTGTELGDPIEIAALSQAFRTKTEKCGFCAIGSLKTNVGHLDVAAGVAGLIKTALAIHHHQIPPSLHFEQPNPKIDFVHSPFYVNTKLREWESKDSPRRAGVSSFGIGGTNAHVVLEEAPNRELSSHSRQYQLLILSAKTASALDTATANLAQHLQSQAQLELADIAYTLQVGRQTFKHRRMLICQQVEDAIASLQNPQNLLSKSTESENSTVVFMFSGQGTQYVNMGKDLYDREPIFREYLDLCCEILQPILEEDLRQILYPEPDQLESAALKLQQTAITQPAIFAIAYALAQQWMAWGIKPNAMIGHSIGEYVAACLAGVMTLEEALSLVAMRGKLMQQLPAGAMLAVPLPEQEIEFLLGQDLSIAAINSDDLCVVSGSIFAIEKLEKKLEKQLEGMGLECRRLRTSHAFHSAMMEPMLEEFRSLVAKVQFKHPNIPYISNVSGNWITASEAIDPDYWVKHIRQTVKFASGIETLLKQPQQVFLEIGAGRTLSTLVSRHPDKANDQVLLTSLRHPQESQSDLAFFLSTLGQLWLAGVNINWNGFYQQEKRQRLPLPTYPFERQRYWIEPSNLKLVSQILQSQEASSRKTDLADWFYIPSWRRSPMLIQQKSNTRADKNYLVFTDEEVFASKLVQQLQQRYQNVVIVKTGQQFTKLDEFNYSLNPDQPEDYDLLLNDLSNHHEAVYDILHLWMVTNELDTNPPLEQIEQCQTKGFYSLIFLAQAIGRQNIADKLRLFVVSNNMQNVAGEVQQAEKATILGALKVIPKEYTNIECSSIDIVLPQAETQQERQLIDRLLSELSNTSNDESMDAIIAYRGNHRWQQTYEAIRLESNHSVNFQLRSGGVYLITGGLGGIGLTLAEYFSRKAQTKLILISRSSFLSRDFWSSWLKEHPENDRTSQTINKLQTLEKMGAEIFIAQADVSNLEQMQGVVSEAIARFGQIHGVVHSAGVPSGGIMQKKTRAELEQVMSPKVKGTFVLNQIFKETSLDFVVLCSSLSAVLGVFGQADYCAANAYLDTFAQNHPFQWNTPVTSINWDTWQQVGMAMDVKMPQDLQASYRDILQYGLLTEEGMEVFSRILNANLSQVLVSTRDFNSRLTQLSPLQTRSSPLSESAINHGRPNLNTAYVPPNTKIEQAIAAIWQQLLGIEAVGVYDNFFELGGHSLLGTQVTSRILQEFQVKLPLSHLFEAPTVTGLAEYVEKRQSNLQAMTIDSDLFTSDREEGEI